MNKYLGIGLWCLNCESGDC